MEILEDSGLYTLGSISVLEHTPLLLLARDPRPGGTCGEWANGSELQASGCTSQFTRGTYTSRCSKSREHICKVVVCVHQPPGGGPRAPWGHWAGCRGWSPRPGMRLCPELGSPGKQGASGISVDTHGSFFTQVPSGSLEPGGQPEPHPVPGFRAPPRFSELKGQHEGAHLRRPTLPREEAAAGFEPGLFGNPGPGLQCRWALNSKNQV